MKFPMPYFQGGARRVALNFPHGFKFDPTDNEVLIYLRKNILDQQLPANVILTPDVYGTKPDELPFCEFKHGDESYWLIFTTKPNGNLVIGEDRFTDSDGEIYEDDGSEKQEAADTSNKA
ncbi:NAC transcription factor 25-like [Forsythia ovata]|uniref:NAC transcription factor 25-like n=1 Tax=Forsythia ovata TaxID=205694 RepID=A0ABD1TQY6_9LAMI